MLEALLVLYRNGRSVPALPFSNKESTVFLQKQSSQNISVDSVATQTQTTWPSSLDLEAHEKPQPHPLIHVPWEGVRFLLALVTVVLLMTTSVDSQADESPHSRPNPTPPVIHEIQATPSSPSETTSLNDQKQSSDKTSLVGYVLSAETGKPLNGVSVTVAGQEAMTDAKGRFVFSQPPAGHQLVTVNLASLDSHRKHRKDVPQEGSCMSIRCW